MFIVLTMYKVKHNKIRFKKGDNVFIISGKDKGKKGTVKMVLPKTGMLLIEGVNIIKRAVKPEHNNNQNFLKKEKPIHLSNVKLVSYNKKNEKEKKNVVKKVIK